VGAYTGRLVTKPYGFPGPWTSRNPARIQDPRDGWRICFDFPGFASERPSDEKVLPKTLT
jgi:hypothetical protein